MMATIQALPIACTLRPGELRERLGLINTLTRHSLVSYERSDLVLRLRYAPDAVVQVRAMVDKESQCCAFLTFDVCEEVDAMRVTIAAPEQARDAADELFAQFVAGGAAITGSAAALRTR
jgi:hypothetical protein